MDNHPIEGLMKTALDSIKQMVDVNTVVGDTTYYLASKKSQHDRRLAPSLGPAFLFGRRAASKAAAFCPGHFPTRRSPGPSGLGLARSPAAPGALAPNEPTRRHQIAPYWLMASLVTVTSTR